MYVIGLVTEGQTNEKLVNELMAWYKDFPFPEYQPAGLNLPTTVAKSSLCHVSVTKWMRLTGLPRSAPERSERCAGLSADVAKFTANMLNQLFESGDYNPAFKPADTVGECMTCHSGNAHGKESCVECHGDPHK